MSKFYFFIIILFGCNSVFSQSLSAYMGHYRPEIYVVTDAIGGVMFDDNYVIDMDYFSLDYPIVDFLDVSLSYWNHESWIGFSVRDPITSAIGGFGAGSTRIKERRFGLGAAVNLITICNAIEIKVSSRIEYEDSNNESAEGGSRILFEGESDIHGYVGTVSIRSYKNNQIIPTVGFSINANLPWRLGLHLKYDWTFGHKITQSYYFDYTYYNEPQPTAEWYTNGTMHIWMIGLSYRFIGPKTKYDKKISLF